MSPWTRIWLGFGLIFLFTLVFGIFLDGMGTILAWASGGSTIADFTGLGDIVSFTPLILWLMGIGFGGWLAFSGVQGVRRGKSGGGSGDSMH